MGLLSDFAMVKRNFPCHKREKVVLNRGKNINAVADGQFNQAAGSRRSKLTREHHSKRKCFANHIGGQTGADRAGLDFAIETGLEHGDMFPEAGKQRTGESMSGTT
jgi:Circularly permutated YpsA SLOG family